MRSQLDEAWGFIRAFVKWVLIAAFIGGICGLVGAAFHVSVERVTELRVQDPWLLFLLPAAGLAIALLYRIAGIEGAGTDDIINSIHNGNNVPLLLVPVIFAATVLTHLCGGSAGREGAALQIGGGIGYGTGRLLHLGEKDLPLATLCGIRTAAAPIRLWLPRAGIQAYE